MTKTMSAYEARTNFGELLNLVYYKDIDVIVEKMGRPMVKIIKAPAIKKTRAEILAKYAGIWANDKDVEKIEAAMKEFRTNFKLTRF